MNKPPSPQKSMESTQRIASEDRRGVCHQWGLRQDGKSWTGVPCFIADDGEDGPLPGKRWRRPRSGFRLCFSGNRRFVARRETRMCFVAIIENADERGAGNLRKWQYPRIITESKVACKMFSERIVILSMDTYLSPVGASNTLQGTALLRIRSGTTPRCYMLATYIRHCRSTKYVRDIP